MIHDRYRQRLFAYTRQMLPGSRPDAEDALQDVFVRAYGALRAERPASSRCAPGSTASPTTAASTSSAGRRRRRPRCWSSSARAAHDPIAEAEQRESLRRLVADVRRLPEQQRSALLMRELGGMAYADLADALGVSVPAVKSLLVRAGSALAQALEARDTACSEIRERAHRWPTTAACGRAARPRRHLRDCSRLPRLPRRAARRRAGGSPRSRRPSGPLGVARQDARHRRRRGRRRGGERRRGAAGGRRGRDRRRDRVRRSCSPRAPGHVATLLAAAVGDGRRRGRDPARRSRHRAPRRRHTSPRRRRRTGRPRRASPRDQPGASSARATAPRSTVAIAPPRRRRPSRSRRHRRRTATNPAAPRRTTAAGSQAVAGHGDGGADRPAVDGHRRHGTPDGSPTATADRRARVDRRRRARPIRRRAGQPTGRRRRTTGNGTAADRRRRPPARRLRAPPATGPRRPATSSVRARRRRPRPAPAAAPEHPAGARSPRSTATSRHSTTRRSSSGAGRARACSRSSPSTRPSAARRSAAAGCGPTTTRARRCATRCACRGR